MSKQDVIETEGIVTEALPNAMFMVELQNHHQVLAPHFRKAPDELHPHPSGR